VGGGEDTSSIRRERVLIVDDVPTNILLLQKALAKEFDVLAASSGEEGLRIAREQHPDLVLLDVMMPGMDGYEVCRRLTSDSMTNDIPVIFLTALNEAKDELQGLRLGAVDYITKPFNLATTLARVRSHIGQRNYVRLRARLANLDGLTGLANRVYFDALLETELKRVAMTGRPMALILADIDHFQAYNNRHGHIAGDACLKTVAARIAEAARPVEGLAARYTGDEFALLLPGMEGAPARDLAEALRKDVEAALIPHPDASHGRVTLSCAVISTPWPPELSPGNLLASAGALLEKAKLGDRNRILAQEGCTDAAPPSGASHAQSTPEQDAIIESIVSITEQQDQRSLDQGLMIALQEMLKPGCILMLEVFTDGQERYTVVHGDAPSPMPPEVTRQARDVTMQQSVRVEARGLSFLCARMDHASENTRRILIICEVGNDGAHQGMFMGMLRVYQNFIRLMREGQKDTLTGLQNRRTLEFELANILSGHMNGRRAHDDSDKGTALAVLDLDKFKRINDTFGHLMGDEVLLVFSQLLRESLRPQDQAFRYGGEEFIVILNDISEEDSARVLERIRGNIEHHDFPQVGRVTVSVGYTRVGGQSLPAHIIEEADKALYYAKEHGRNQVRYFASLPAEAQVEPGREGGDIQLF
jgi:diguanylate cyclase (GGDEF)-like protein